ncbi:hypothetical protein [Rheinheimera nanhaiensis]|uniref:Uncharacterized protein n=1 Tax=Rheinheimera nanhaiensis E407-8 TaxID=562729 RepID=I1E181_9GAMM|nr:hypothetical protein [Rheinheimera nanhaiensis]GAB60059.1 hypothetical protein RNAN_3073 [Rheinheimera nanhaiensis E407-8]
MNAKTWLLLCVCSTAAAQQTAEVQIDSTISGNQEQPKTIYVLPWQSPVGEIRIAAEPLAARKITLSPLDRPQFLRFIALKQDNNSALNPTTVNEKQQ